MSKKLATGLKAAFPAKARTGYLETSKILHPRSQEDIIPEANSINSYGKEMSQVPGILTILNDCIHHHNEEIKKNVLTLMAMCK